MKAISAAIMFAVLLLTLSVGKFEAGSAESFIIVILLWVAMAVVFSLWLREMLKKDN